MLNNMTSSQRARVADLQQKLNNEVRQPFVYARYLLSHPMLTSVP